MLTKNDQKKIIQKVEKRFSDYSLDAFPDCFMPVPSNSVIEVEEGDIVLVIKKGILTEEEIDRLNDVDGKDAAYATITSNLADEGMKYLYLLYSVLLTGAREGTSVAYGNSFSREHKGVIIQEETAKYKKENGI